MRTRVPLTPELLRSTEAGRFVRVELDGLRVVVDDVVARTALVGRPDGTWRAYANVCRHLAVPLDVGADSPMSVDGVTLLCHQHGARYRTTDGYCVGGPCMGATLVKVNVVEEEGAILLG